MRTRHQKQDRRSFHAIYTPPSIRVTACQVASPPFDGHTGQLAPFELHFQPPLSPFDASSRSNTQEAHLRHAYARRHGAMTIGRAATRLSSEGAISQISFRHRRRVVTFFHRIATPSIDARMPLECARRSCHYSPRARRRSPPASASQQESPSTFSFRHASGAIIYAAARRSLPSHSEY